jgi:ABC-2 type transport system ATP-binding protein
MISTDGLTKRFGDFTAVRGIDLSVREGEVLALLGPNGAGKTTTVRMLSAILAPSAGQATVNGYDVVKDAQKVRQSVGLLTEFHGLYLRMKALEYLNFFGELQSMTAPQRRERSEMLLRRFELWDARGKRLGEYSKGMRQKLALIRAMIHDPEVLFLDEPTSAMDPHSAKLVRDSIASLKHEGRTVVVCTHNLSEAELLADRIAVIRLGEIIALGTPDDLKLDLLGDPLLEIRFAGPLDGLLSVIEDRVNVVSSGTNWIRYRTPEPQVTNPQVLGFLAQIGAPVVTLSEVSRSLEEVYLMIVSE